MRYAATRQYRNARAGLGAQNSSKTAWFGLSGWLKSPLPVESRMENANEFNGVFGVTVL
jgi:hypothetical protein